jgi:serine/threonine-protein kinase
MPLSPGTRLGPYEILSAIGAGGMGEVYRARDSKLGRDVAVKILPDTVATDLERLARFQREAQVLASLNHPHIAAIYGLEESNGTQFLVLELVDGESLDKRIARGKISLDEALAIATQIAEALEAAHEKGIVHRDLKPANVAVNKDGQVKVLDFGLAKAGAASGDGMPPLTNSPTVTSPVMMTGVGVILGTAAYMSPEQAKGLPADHRSDVFSFGVVLYEVLTGRPPFAGETATDILASVLAREPDFTRLAPDVPPRLIDLLKRCLEKQPRRRWQAIGDVRLELEPIAANPRIMSAAVPTVQATRPMWRRALPAVMSGVLVCAVTAAVMWSARSAPEAPVTRFSFGLAAGQQLFFGQQRLLAVSPDGEQIVYVAGTPSGGAANLYLHRTAEFDTKAIPGAAGGIPTFSPDGRWLAFYSAGPDNLDPSIKKVTTGGGAAVTVCRLAGVPVGGISWNREEILFGDGGSIQRVSANGGAPETIVRVKADERAYGPQRLPNTDTIVFTLATRAGASIDPWDDAQIVAESLTSHERKTLITGGSDGRYVPTGHLVYVRGGVLMAIPFDLRRLAVVGGPVPVVEGVRRADGLATGAAHFDVSNTGSLVYFPGPVSGSSAAAYDLVLSDRAGSVERLKIPAGPYAQPRISPDGTRLAVAVANGSDSNVAIYDLSSRTAMRRLTFGGHDRYPVWSPDSQHVAFQSDREGDRAIFWQAVDGGTAERLTKAQPGESHIPDSWSATGDTLLFSVMKEKNATLWALSHRDKSIARFDAVESRLPINAVFSPDGRWVAYEASNPDGGGVAVYVQPFPPTGTKNQISKSDEVGHHPLWSPDGKELSYIPAPSRLVAVSITAQPSFAFGTSVPLLRRFSIANGQTDVRNHDITPDGKRFIGVTGALTGDQSSGAFTPEIRVVLNWFEELKARVPSK